MLDRFIQAALPEPVTCLGVRLKPFSLGHWLWLHRVKSPYVTYAPARLDNLILAVIICCQRYEDNQLCFSGRDRSVESAVKQFTKNILGAWYRRPIVFKGKKLCGPLLEPPPFNFLVTSALFAKYISDAFHLPTLASKGGDDNPTEAPWELITLTTCLRLQNSANEVLNQPIGFSRWLVAGFCETEGTGQLKDPKRVLDDLHAANEFADKLRAEGRMK